MTYQYVNPYTAGAQIAGLMNAGTNYLLQTLSVSIGKSNMQELQPLTEKQIGSLVY
ncbi:MULTISPECIES: hypothetical protein [Bacillus]|uniref:hypothetical protein n=1 Tax=Bacillus TaxID=1386 RepID=UPI001FCA9F04|nr:hypothetical protein [Bacillus paralicheniformis]BCE07011.1 hypothetical protein RSC1_03168 [Bacillus paralicheniformis]BCE08810.1 hypothetical protein RSC2_00606 [Bacillus paralicheniformis]BCE14929.1 hypothetical protein RSC3_02285 [Bacillus paralicheniformis]